MIKNIFERFGVGWIFFVVVIVTYLIVALINIEIVTDSLSNFALLVWKILPVIVSVFVLIFIFNLFIEPKTLVKYLGANSGIAGWLIAIAGGIISTGPIYMWYPLLSDLKEKGVRRALLAAFLYSRAVKLPLLPLMIYYFGLSFTAVVCIYLSLFSIINGSLVEYFSKEEQ